MYRFLATPRWIGFAALMIVASTIMVGLGFWQLDRYHIRHAVNLRIDHANATPPVPMASVLTLGHPITTAQQWTRVSVTGTYDAAHTIVARDRTNNGNVGFEILTPLVLADGSVIMIDRGWLPPGTGGAVTPPILPVVPPGPVRVTGRLHLPESHSDVPVRVGDVWTVRRIAPDRFASTVAATEVYPDYVLMDAQQPAATGGFARIPADRQPAWLDAGYVVQWWCFSLLVLFGFGWAARREAHDRRDGIDRSANRRIDRSRDRLSDDPAVGYHPADHGVASNPAAPRPADLLG